MALQSENIIFIVQRPLIRGTNILTHKPFFSKNFLKSFFQICRELLTIPKSIVYSSEKKLKEVNKKLNMSDCSTPLNFERRNHYSFFNLSGNPMSSVYNRFSEKDDNKLRELVKQYGDSNWKLIASKMHGRNKRQCRDRWMRYLAPTVNHSPWSQQEDDLLMNLVPKMYPKWREISKHFNGRNDIQTKNRYKVICNRIKNDTTTVVNEIPSIDILDGFEIDDNFRLFDEFYTVE